MLWGGLVLRGVRGRIEGDLALMADSCPLLKALADLNGWGVEMQGHCRVSVGVVLHTMEANRICYRK